MSLRFLCEFILQLDEKGGIGNPFRIRKIGSCFYRILIQEAFLKGFEGSPININTILSKEDMVVLADELYRRGSIHFQHFFASFQEQESLCLPFSELGIAIEQNWGGGYRVLNLNSNLSLGILDRVDLKTKEWVWIDNYISQFRWRFQAPTETMGNFLKIRTSDDFPLKKFQEVGGTLIGYYINPKVLPEPLRPFFLEML